MRETVQGRGLGHFESSAQKSGRERAHNYQSQTVHHLFCTEKARLKFQKHRKFEGNSVGETSFRMLIRLDAIVIDEVFIHDESIANTVDILHRKSKKSEVSENWLSYKISEKIARFKNCRRLFSTDIGRETETSSSTAFLWAISAMLWTSRPKLPWKPNDYYEKFISHCIWNQRSSNRKRV